MSPHRPESPPDQDDGVTELQDNVGGLLEDAGIEAEIVDAIMMLIRKGEQQRDADNALAAVETAKDPRF